ncbi:homoserine dehydrogenase [Polymorphobacter fuscus]|uniref:Homoserine dehydrogenase n=1 Tax=Sandarakinorhabdus fusca TaxID=1439888 RepID=A0A7C9KZZ3_9SPHN|nr:homoserine dehydrogenase [Polymorphobacter fuscus]KAB7643868.1 homoserine dehydrogenase [Polymorphobacter fuscus]MQT18568.1 homoserine dehydrogenase [Polymorphobacter fuscus]NJC07065.1 homoserine dehydrogenase [Polymorphobacter fuscus]
MPHPLRIGLAGLGNVGAGVVRLLADNADLVARRADRPVVVTAVSARDRNRNRNLDLAPYAWVDDATELAGRDDVDVVVELIGGSDGPALTLARRSIDAGKALVTANKAMLAHHGLDLAARAEARGTALRYEAAVAGGIPIIKALGEGMAANRIDRVYGLLNGTCNYILTRMESERLAFATVLAEAQAAGFAEADPSFDIDGIDTAHKLAILAALAFGSRIDFGSVATQGIRAIELADLDQAAALGFRIKLVGLAENLDGTLFQRVHPALVPLDHPLAAASGALNAVAAEGDFVGRLFFQGRGAGEGPTASAVVADLVDIARGVTTHPFGMPVAALTALPTADPASRRGRYYLRLTVADRPGVLAELTAALRDHGVSIESLVQRGQSASGDAMVVMITHVSAEVAVLASLAQMQGSDAVTGAPVMMHILDF